jgi:hypothetical protein
MPSPSTDLPLFTMWYAPGPGIILCVTEGIRPAVCPLSLVVQEPRLHARERLRPMHLAFHALVVPAFGVLSRLHQLWSARWTD